MVLIESEPPTAAWAEHMLDAFRELEVFVGDPERMAEQPEIYQRMEATARTLNGTTTAGADVVAPAGLMTADEVAAVDVPMLFVVGGRSKLHAHLSTVLPMLSRCAVEVIADRDHMLLVQAPQQVSAAMVPWLGSFVGTAVVS
jgi:pimeloyl-ACP methyl ester carboxylesterase